MGEKKYFTMMFLNCREMPIQSYSSNSHSVQCQSVGQIWQEILTLTSYKLRYVKHQYTPAIDTKEILYTDTDRSERE